MAHIKPSLFFIALLLISAFGAYIAVSMRMPSDDEMLSRFSRHRDIFNDLLQMYRADNQDMWLAPTGSYWVGRSTSTGVSLMRRIAYARLMFQSGIRSMGIGGVRETRAEAHPTVPFYANVALPGSPVKYFLYSELPLTFPTTESETSTFRFPQGTTYRAVCRPMDDHWFICMDYED